MCPHCHELIISSLLAEIDEIACRHCNEGVPVRNVLISARGMTINRDDLLKRFFRYKRLLTETIEERDLMDENVESLETSKKSADQFIKTLEELMAGARDNYRLDFSLTVPVRISYDGKVQSGWMVNLSMVGACIETENFYFMPSVGSTVSIEFSLPGNNKIFALSGMIAWIKGAGQESDSLYDIGVKFVEVDDQIRADLWQLISSSVHQVMGEKQLQ
jgi:Tfp pilus assembly protein PilZ